MGVPEIVYYVAASADGFIATADGGVDWLSPFEGGDDDYGYAAFLAGVDAILLGRTTYEQVLTFGDWPYAGKTSWVFSHRAQADIAERVTITSDTPSDVAAMLDEAGVSRAWLVGGGELAGSFARADLITGYIISVMPVLLGNGVRLLGRQGAPGQLALDSTTRMGEVIQNVYRVAR
jgi:dihydrofolate reductase